MTPAVQSGERQIVMKVLMICGSARQASNSSLALDEMKKIFESEGIDAETVTVGNGAVHGRIGCGACMRACTFKAIVAGEKPGERYTIRGERCDECGNCYLACPVSAIKTRRELQEA